MNDECEHCFCFPKKCVCKTDGLLKKEIEKINENDMPCCKHCNSELYYCHFCDKYFSI